MGLASCQSIDRSVGWQTIPQRPREAQVTIAISRRGSIGVLQIDRPAARNALDDRLLDSLLAAVEGMRDDSEVRALVLTGAGTVFCAGDDLKAAVKATRAQFAATIHRLQTLSVALLDLGKPTVAALNGPAFGGGLELALNCDLRIATANFQCATPEVQLGLTPTNAATVLLPLIVGHSNARRMLFSGARFDADWCLQAGLIDELTTAADLLPRAIAMAQELSSGAPLALAATRRLLNAPLRETLKRALDAEEEVCVAAHGAEALAGVRAFLAKEPTPWK
jgi:enoyl-CoA hydratase